MKYFILPSDQSQNIRRVFVFKKGKRGNSFIVGWPAIKGLVWTRKSMKTLGAKEITCKQAKLIYPDLK